MPIHDWQYVAALKVSYELDGNRLSNRLHYYGDDFLTADRLDELSNAWVSSVLPLWQDCVSADCNFSDLEIHCIKPGVCAPSLRSFTSESGTDAADALPTNIAAIFQLRQVERSGRHNGRLFMAGVSETNVENGLLTAAFAAGPMQALADELILPITTASLSYYLGLTQWYGTPPPSPDTYPCTLVSPMRNLATQRRRKTELRLTLP